MSHHNRCLSCMTPLSGASSCPACGVQAGSEPDNPLYLPAGCLLNNRYLIGRVIGVGGFGIVYLAWDNNLDIKVAIKEYLPKEYAARASDHLSLTPYTGNAKDEYGFGMEKFLDEAKALAKFQDHVGIVTVYESFKANNTAYMVMQYLDGITLKEFLKKQPNERISFDLAVKALTPIMDALREVHNAGYVHRDISPDNIFITRQKQVKLLDFGAARYAIGEHSKSLTTVLKHGYAPVEQYSTKGNQGPWTDVYAVAATIYRCITGEVPADAMERMQGDETIKSPKQMGIEIPLQGESALMKGLALSASNRFASVQDLQAALLGVVPLDAPASPASDVIQPRRAADVKTIECPECGAKNQLQPGDDPGALRCGRCRRELGVKAIGSVTVQNVAPQPDPSQVKKPFYIYIFEFIVGMLGVLTALVTGLILALIEEYFNIAIYSYSLWAIIPVGAIISGLVASSGYYAGAVWLRQKPIGGVLLSPIIASIGAFIVVYYVGYLRFTLLVPDMSFASYFDLVNSHSRLFIGRASESSIELSKFWGYVFAIIQIAGFSIGGLIVSTRLSKIPYCDTCSKFLQKNSQDERFLSDNSDLITRLSQFRSLLDINQINDAIQFHADKLGTPHSVGHYYRTRIIRSKCTKCGVKHLDFIVSKRTGDAWEDVDETKIQLFYR